MTTILVILIDLFVIGLFYFVIKATKSNNDDDISHRGGGW